MTEWPGGDRPKRVRTIAGEREDIVTQATELKHLIQTIFEDGLVEPHERAALSKLTEGMESSEVLAVFQGFLHDKWGEAMEDGVVTAQERNLLGKILTELGLQLAHLPEQAQLALRDVL